MSATLTPAEWLKDKELVFLDRLEEQIGDAPLHCECCNRQTRYVNHFAYCGSPTPALRGLPDMRDIRRMSMCLECAAAMPVPPRTALSITLVSDKHGRRDCYAQTSDERDFMRLILEASSRVGEDYESAYVGYEADDCSHGFTITNLNQRHAQQLMADSMPHDDLPAISPA